MGITGEMSAFRDLNPAASTFATIISLEETAKFHVVGSMERMEMGDGKEYTLSKYGAGGATGRDTRGSLHVFVQRPQEGYGWSFFGGSGLLPLSNNLGTIVGHEFGHALEHMFYKSLGYKPTKEQSDRGALDLENKVRRLQNGPNSAVRLRHQ